MEKINTELICGAIQKNSTSYSTHFERNFNVDGSPSEYDLEAMYNSPQSHINQMVGYSKYCYRKYGIIMRVVNLMRDFGSTKIFLSYPKKDKYTKEIIEKYNKKIDVQQLTKNMMYELIMTGNLVCYDRDGKRVDIYPINNIEVLPLVVDNKQLVAYKANELYNYYSNLIYDKDVNEAIKTAYPQELADAISGKSRSQYVKLNPENAYFAKVNSSQYERYGTPVLLPAFEDLAHKSLLKEAERSTANAIIDRVLCVSVGDSDNKPSRTLIDAYDSLFNGLNGSVRVTVPYYVDIKWIEPDTTFFGRDKFVQIDNDILNTLGVSLTLIRGEGSSGFADGMISFTSLTRTIESIREPIPSILNGLYRKELERNGINPDNAPTVKFTEVVIDKESKLNLVKELFQNAGLPYEILYEEYGYDYDHIKLVRQEENTNNEEDIFKLRAQPFQGFGQNNEGGREEEDLTSRKTDPSYSNNDTPRPKITIK